MIHYKDLTIDQKVILWSVIVTLIVSIPVFWMGQALTVFALSLGLLPWHFLVQSFGGRFADLFLSLIPLISPTLGFGLVLGAYWILSRAIIMALYQLLRSEPSLKTLKRTKITSAVMVNFLYFLFLYVFFPASPGMYP